MAPKGRSALTVRVAGAGQTAPIPRRLRDPIVGNGLAYRPFPGDPREEIGMTSMKRVMTDCMRCSRPVVLEYLATPGGLHTWPCPTTDAEWSISKDSRRASSVAC